MTGVRVDWVEDLVLRGTAREHHVMMDRLPESGGSDRGFTSRELLLLAVGSCVAGSARAYLSERGVDHRRLGVSVTLEDEAVEDEAGSIMVDLTVDGDAASKELLSAAGAGRVSRLVRTSRQVSLRFNAKDADA